MPPLDSRIDELYQGPLESFTASRNALAKTLTGSEKKQVMALVKPLVIPWLVNQTYWHARETYDELLSAGRKLRDAQVGGLQGRSTDVRAASDRHEQALGAAVRAATKLADGAPQTDLLRRMFEAVSTRTSLPTTHGRFVRMIEPAGFEALTGLSIVASPRVVEAIPAKSTTKSESKTAANLSAAEVKAGEREERRRAREREQAKRARDAAIAKAKARVAEAERAEHRARFEWERAKKNVEAANRALEELMSKED